MNRQRKLSNIRLTRQFHWRHMGMWVVISVLLVVLVNVMAYIVAMHLWWGGEPALEPPTPETLLLRRGMLALQAIETVLFSFALLLLARATSHRIAGAFIGLQHVCERIAAGERDVRAHFRTYDGLENLEGAFNRMVDSLAGKPRGK